jgi:FxLD family lantipeptide
MYGFRTDGTTVMSAIGAADTTAPAETEPALSHEAGGFDLDIRLIESGDEADSLLNLTDDGCSASCPQSCVTNMH